MSAVTNVQAAKEQAATNILCTAAGFRRGVRVMVPLSIGAIAWGITFGVVADNASYSPVAAVLMSLAVYSGSAQIVAMEMVQGNGGLLAILGMALLMSLRYILMGVTMSGWFRHTPRWLFWPGIHYTSDQSWAMTLNEIRAGRRDVGFFFGINLTMVAMWVFGTVLGATAGGWLTGHIHGLHFAATAALVGVLGEMECRRRDVAPWIVAGITAVLSHQLIGGFWHMALGVMAGMAALMIQEAIHDRHH